MVPRDVETPPHRDGVVVASIAAWAVWLLNTAGEFKTLDAALRRHLHRR
jgi:hypothetical protein